MKLATLTLILVFRCVAAFLRGEPQAVLKADLAQLQQSHEATQEVLSRADKEFEAAQGVIFKLGLFIKETKDVLPNDTSKLLSSLKARSSALSKVSFDLKSASAIAL